jgi:hypothetical protein
VPRFWAGWKVPDACTSRLTVVIVTVLFSGIEFRLFLMLCNTPNVFPVLRVTEIAGSIASTCSAALLTLFNFATALTEPDSVTVTLGVYDATV